MGRHLISVEEDLSIDWIDADPGRTKNKVLLITTGLHGVEGFVGVGMVDLFLKEFLPKINSADTALILVHALNPWGMANQRRFNRGNIDLNRNFMLEAADFEKVSNHDYLKLDRVLNPRRPLKPFWQEDILFLLSVIVNLARYGVQTLREAVLKGQRSNPDGLYFTGWQFQPETIWAREMIGELLDTYQQFLHLDMHTGYGPSDQMSLVIAPSEPRSSEQAVRDFVYPLVFKADPDEFYSMQGDMVEWIYQARFAGSPETRLFSAACEFGTYGAGTVNEALSLRTMVYINQADQQGTATERVRQKIHDLFVEMYFPGSSTWREKAIADCRQAFRGVLKAEGYIRN